MADLILPDSNIYIGAVRAGRDPFREFAAGIEDRDWEFATCGMIVLEVCRGQRDPNLLARYRERFTAKRSDGARRMRGNGAAAAGVLWSARNLRVRI
jgi:hypothetical protein